MAWKILHFEFDEDTRRLSRNGHSESLEPRQAELLAFFCRNPGRTIGRDEMIDAVWERSAVTDSAINRIVAKLRSALGDDARQAQFIVTLPRKGYRFIAPVQRMGDAPPDVPSSGSRLSWALMAGIVLVIVASALWVFGKRSPQPPRFKSVTALTRGAELEFLPAVSPNNRYLIYSAQIDGRLDMFIKDLATERISLISDQKGNAGRGDWSRDGDRFLYLYTGPTDCELRIVTFDADDTMEVVERETVHECGGSGLGALAFGHDGHTIIFSEAPDPNGVFRIRVKDLETEEIRDATQPPQYLAAHREFDLHPTEDRLLVASPDERQRLAFYIVDLESDSFRHLYSIDAYMCCPIWDARGKGILMTGPLPAFSVVSMNLSEPTMRTVYDSAHRIHRLKRIPNSDNLVYSGGLYATNIVQVGRDGRELSNAITSALPDYLPVLSNDESQLAFVSDRSDSGAIWLRAGDSAQRRLTQGTILQRYYDLKWSPNDQKLAALTINSIDLVDVVSGQQSTLDIPQQAIRGLSWFDDETVAFSLMRNTQWQVYHYHLPSRSLRPISDDVAYRYYSLGHSLTLAEDGRPLDLPGPELDRAIVDINRRFTVELRGSNLYYRMPDGDRMLLHQRSLETGSDQILLEVMPEVQFTVGVDSIWMTREGSQQADIFRIEF